MIKVTTKTINNRQFIARESDTYMIQKVGTNEIYASVIDLVPCNFEYIETNELLPVYEQENNDELL